MKTTVGCIDARIRAYASLTSQLFLLPSQMQMQTQILILLLLLFPHARLPAYLPAVLLAADHVSLVRGGEDSNIAANAAALGPDA